MTFCRCYRRRLISSIPPACLFLPTISISSLFYRLRNRSPFISVLCACSVFLGHNGGRRDPQAAHVGSVLRWVSGECVVKAGC